MICKRPAYSRTAGVVDIQSLQWPTVNLDARCGSIQKIGSEVSDSGYRSYARVRLGDQERLTEDTHEGSVRTQIVTRTYNKCIPSVHILHV